MFKEKIGEKGFQIEDKKNKIVVETIGYFLEEKRIEREQLIWTLSIIGALAAILFILYLARLDPDAWWSQIIFFLFSLGILAYIGKWIILFILYGSKNDFKEYHASSHKMIALLEKKLEPTLENFLKMPRIYDDCKIGDYIAQRFIITKEPSLIKALEAIEMIRQYYKELTRRQSNTKNRIS